MDQLVMCALEQFLVGMEKLSQKRVESFLATSFWQDISNSCIYCVLNEKDQILKKLSCDQGPWIQTLYSPLNVLRLLLDTKQVSGKEKLKWQELDLKLFTTTIPTSHMTTWQQDNNFLDTGHISGEWDKQVKFWKISILNIVYKSLSK